MILNSLFTRPGSCTNLVNYCEHFEDAKVTQGRFHFSCKVLYIINAMNELDLITYLQKIELKQNVDSRISWDEYFMRICCIVSERSTCVHRKVGAVIVKENRILATGYNQPPSGFPHCDSIGCIRDDLKIPSGRNQEICYGLHAEQNALMQAARFGISTNGATIYVTAKPCSVCARLIINAGILRVVYFSDYPDPLTDYFFRACNIKVELVNITGGESFEG